MLREQLKDKRVILASASPRRKELLEGLDVNFSIQIRPVEELFSPELQKQQVTEYLSKLKANAFHDITNDQIVITADTIVWMNGRALNKPANPDEAHFMLRELSGNKHQVITSVCFTSRDYQKVVSDTTMVLFRSLTEKELNYYVGTYRPYDKAGSYGIQEWIGLVGIEKIEGCYFNVMGLPTRLVYKTLMELGNSG